MQQMAMQQQAMTQQQMQMGMGQMGQMAPVQSPWVIYLSHAHLHLLRYHTQQGQPYYYNEQTGRDCRTQTLLAISNMFQDTSADGNCESVFFQLFPTISQLSHAHGQSNHSTAETL